jgi:hypothetical protein
MEDQTKRVMYRLSVTGRVSLDKRYAHRVWCQPDQLEDIVRRSVLYFNSFHGTDYKEAEVTVEIDQ